MSIALICGHCEQAFYVNDRFAGKRIKCPRCEGKLEVPAGEGAQGGQALNEFMQWASGGSGMAMVEDDSQWFLQTSTGKQYGPVPKKVLDYWRRLGAVTARSQVLRAGDNQWRWANEVYAELG